MPKLKKLVNSQAALEEAHLWLDEQWDKFKYFWVHVASNKRTLDQNALQFHWYLELEEQGDMTANEYRNYCKLTFGMPILMVKEPDIGFEISMLLSSLDYERQLKAMEYIDMTSRFDVPEMSQYLDTMYKHFSFEGFHLTNGKDLLGNGNGKKK